MTQDKNSNKRKSESMGMSYGKASHRLRKSLMFMLAKKCNMTKCYQCGMEIETDNELSIEHIEPWFGADDPLDKFFDLDNIAFSHLRCNAKAARKPNKRFPNNNARWTHHTRLYRAEWSPEKREHILAVRRKNYADKKTKGSVAQQERAPVS